MISKSRLEELIEQGAVIYDIFQGDIYLVDLTMINKLGDIGVEYYNDYYHCNLCRNANDLFKTKAEAEHYLHHANVTRTDTLPFLTWEEFLNKKEIEFITKNMVVYKLCILTDQVKKKTIGITHIINNGFMALDFEYELTEEDFYKAYDECVRLFKGEWICQQYKTLKHYKTCQKSIIMVKQMLSIFV